jgi:hypothetical protein
MKWFHADHVEQAVAPLSYALRNGLIMARMGPQLMPAHIRRDPGDSRHELHCAQSCVAASFLGWVFGHSVGLIAVGKSGTASVQPLPEKVTAGYG